MAVKKVDIDSAMVVGQQREMIIHFFAMTLSANFEQLILRVSRHVLPAVAGGGCCHLGPVDWPGTAEAPGPAQQPARTASERCKQTGLFTGMHTHIYTCIFAVCQ